VSEVLPFRHRVRVRYGEVDMQGVVFNAHYLAWCDDALEVWFGHLGLRGANVEWDCMVVKAVVEWSGAARAGDHVDIDVAVTRWGTTSLDVAYTGTVGERALFTATITYVGVRLGTTTPMPPPDEVRSRLGEPRAGGG
jgi:acyl-CoA thioester hydrolase